MFPHSPTASEHRRCVQLVVKKWQLGLDLEEI